MTSFSLLHVHRSDLVAILIGDHTQELHSAQRQSVCGAHQHLPAGTHLQVSS